MNLNQHPSVKWPLLNCRKQLQPIKDFSIELKTHLIEFKILWCQLRFMIKVNLKHKTSTKIIFFQLKHHSVGRFRYQQWFVTVWIFFFGNLRLNNQTDMTKKKMSRPSSFWTIWISIKDSEIVANLEYFFHLFSFWNQFGR